MARGDEAAGEVEEALAAIGDPALDVETRSVFALLVLDAVDRMAAYGRCPRNCSAGSAGSCADAQVGRGCACWTHMEGSQAVLGTLC